MRRFTVRKPGAAARRRAPAASARFLGAELLEDRRMLHVLTTGSGDGSLSVDVDGYGSFGVAVFASSSIGAVYDPIGPIDAASTTFESGVAVGSGTGGRQFLTSGQIGGSGGLPAPVVTGNTTTAQSSFASGQLAVDLMQAVSLLLNDNGVQTGSVLTQRYVITNTGGAASSFEIIRYIDGDLLFDGTLVDGGGRLLTEGREFLFETDAGGGGATATTFLGVDANGGTVPTIGRFEVDSFSGLVSRIIDGVALDNQITGDLDGDGFVDPGQEYDVTLAMRNQYTIAPGASATFTTRTVFGSGTPDDLPADSTIAVADVMQLEGDSGLVPLVFAVNVERVNDLPIFVEYATADGSATAPADYQAQSGTLTFEPGGPTTQLVTIDVVGDLTVEPHETFSLRLSGAVNAFITHGDAVATILNDDIEASIGDATLVEGHSGARDALFTISVVGEAGQDITIGYTTSNGTAAAPGDFSARGGSITLSPGQHTAVVTVPVLGDTLNEGTETFFVHLVGAQGARIADGVGVGTILDDDPLPNLYVSDVQLTSTAAGQLAAVFAVALDVPSGREVTVAYATSDGTARDGVDYSSRSGVVTFSIGVTTQLVTVPVMTSADYSSNKRFYLNLLSPTSAITIDPQGAATMVYAPGPQNEYIIDNGAGGYTQSAGWTNLTNTLAYHLDYDYAPAGNGSAAATWSFIAIPNGPYQVFARWIPFNNRATNAPFTIAAGTTTLGTVLVNQQLAPNDDQSNAITWKSLGTFTAANNQLSVRLANGANGIVVADAVRIVANGIAPQVPEMDVAGFDHSIGTGDATPAGDDATDFGTVASLVNSPVHVFTISNHGNANLHLTGNPPVTIGGANAADFIVVAQPAAVVTPGMKTTFSVVFRPSAGGLRTALVSIANNDDTEHPYTFALHGTGGAAAPPPALAHNAAWPEDVNADNRVSTGDVLIVINNLLSASLAPAAAPLAAAPLTAAPAASAATAHYVDVNGDGRVTPIDVLKVINYLLSPPVSLPSAAPKAASGAPLLAPAAVDAVAAALGAKSPPSAGAAAPHVDLDQGDDAISIAKSSGSMPPLLAPPGVEPALASQADEDGDVLVADADLDEHLALLLGG